MKTDTQTASTFNEALQQAKEAIGFFANGDLSHVANEAKRLWHIIDNSQQGKRSVTQAEKLAEALRKCLSLAASFDATEREKKKHKGIYDKEHWIITETRKTLAEYEAAQ